MPGKNTQAKIDNLVEHGYDFNLDEIISDPQESIERFFYYNKYDEENFNNALNDITVTNT